MRYVSTDMAGVPGVCDCPEWPRMTVVDANSIELVSWPLTDQRDLDVDSSIVEAIRSYEPVEFIVSCPTCLELILSRLVTS